MFSPSSLHPAAFFAIPAVIFLYLYAQHRHPHLILWAAGWAALAVRHVAAAVDADFATSWVAVHEVLLVVAGVLFLLGGVAFSGRRRRGFAGAALFGVVLGAIAAIVLAGLAWLAPFVGAYRAAALSVLVAGWIGTGWLIYRFGREEAPFGARLAGVLLAAWGVWVPMSLVLDTRLAGDAWPAQVEAGLGALTAVGIVILGFEEARTRLGARAYARRFLDEDPNMITVLQDDRVVFANRAFLERLGRPLDELQRVDIRELVAPEYREAPQGRVMNELGQPLADHEIELLDVEGGRVPVIVHADPIVWEGRPAQKYELADIAPRRRAEEEVRRVNAELMRMNTELERVNQLQSAFLSNTSHELKTPLTSIMANTEILEYEMCGPINDEQRRVLANIGRNSQQLLEMISRLLDFARQRAGAAALRLEEVNPREILEGVVDTVRPLLEEKGVALEIQADPDLGTCWLDGEKIYRVYLNLVENAVKFSTKGTILVGAWIVESEFEGSVEDQGIGIPEDRLEDVFQAFSQVDASSTRPYPGVGLGLAICRQLVELHGGRIWAESEIGRGSTFRFRVPCTPPVLPVVSEPIEAEAAQRDTPTG